MRTKDLIAKRERRERKHARSERNHMEKKAQVKVPAKEVFTLPTDFSDEVLKELRQLPDIISQELSAKNGWSGRVIS